MSSPTVTTAATTGTAPRIATVRDGRNELGMSGRTAHITASPARSPTLAPNSVAHGAMSSVQTTPSTAPNTIRAVRPDGTVLGSVIMKNRKMKISGEVITTHQKCHPLTGVNDHRVVMLWPVMASTASPAASDSHSARLSPSNRSRPQIQNPPAKITTYANAIAGAERRPPEVERLDPVAAEDEEGDDQADVRRVEHVGATRGTG